MVRKQSSSSVQRHTSVVTQRKKLPDNITCGICRKDFTSAAACSEHMKMHSRARSAPTAATTSFSSNSRCLHQGSSIPVPSQHVQRPRTSVDRSRTAFPGGGGGGGVGVSASAPSGKRVASAPFLGKVTQRSCHLQRGGGSSSKRPPCAEPGRSCFNCQAEFPDQKSLSKHSRTHGGVTPYSCTRCGRMFALYSTLMTHERSHLPVRSPACRCHRCGARFLHEASLKAHLRRHEEEAEDGPESKPYQCGTCREWLSNEGSLKIHMQRHEGLDTARSTCTLCGMGFSSDAILRAHVRLHDAEPATRCVICIRPFRRSRVLLRHSDVHADERQNVCDTCEKRFPKVADGSWRRSQLLMPDERQFRCLYCGDRFSRLYQLAAHETGHTVLPPDSGNGDLSPPVVVVN